MDAAADVVVGAYCCQPCRAQNPKRPKEIRRAAKFRGSATSRDRADSIRGPGAPAVFVCEESTDSTDLAQREDPRPRTVRGGHQAGGPSRNLETHPFLRRDGCG